MWQSWSSFSLAVAVSLAAMPAAAQVEVTVQGGLHVDVAAAAHGREQPERPRDARRLPGEATTTGVRVAVGLAPRWQLDGGVAWSRSSTWEGAVSRTLPSFDAHSMFISSTIQGRLTEPEARFGVVAGMGPAVIVQRGNGVADDQTNLGGLLTFGGVMRLDRRFSLRLDAQQYLFSSAFDDPYTPHLGTAPTPEHAAGMRHDFVVLAGFSWRSD